MKNAKNDILWRIYLLYFSIVLFAFVIIGKIVYIQFVQGAELASKAKPIPIRFVVTEIQKGNIYADDGVSMLVTSIPYFEIRMDVGSPEFTDDYFYSKVDSLSKKLSLLFPNRTSRNYSKSLKEARKNNNRFFLIARRVSYDTLKILRTFPILKDGNRGGLIAKEQVVRKLLYGDIASRTIGYFRNGFRVGLEGYYCDDLNGTKAIQMEQQTNDKEWKPIGKANELEVKNGYDVITTIDVKIQDVAEKALRTCLDTNKAEHGCVILMEVKTGYIKAIANLLKTGEHQYEERYNYATGERVEPGSTFKLMSLLAAMEDGADTSMIVNITGASTTYSNRKMEDSHNLGLGKINMIKAFEISSNVGVSKIVTEIYNRANKNECKKYTDRLYDMGLNEPLGLKIIGEATPIVKNPNFRSWSNTTLPWMSIGYEVALTPMQILSIYNAVANDGVKVRPLFVKEIRSAGKVIEKFEPEILNSSICSKQTIAKAKFLLENVVQNGTGKRLKNPFYKVAGKTGTAQIAQQNSGYNKSNYRASFVGYFPADRPEYSMIVVVHNPTSGKYYGGEVAAPVFKEVADKIYAAKIDLHHEIINTDTVTRNFITSGNRSDLSIISNVLGVTTTNIPVEDNWVSLAYSVNSANKKCSANLVNKLNTSNGVVPDVMGMRLKDAVYLLESAGLNVKIKGKGIVVKQSIESGTKATKNSTIFLELAI